MIKANQVPQHIAVIMDGNRRWARARGLPILEGHRQVADKVLEPLIEYAATLGVKHMTFWAFSTENWGREAAEVRGIMAIFRHVIKKRWARLHEKGVRVKVIGDLSRFPDDIQKALWDVMEQTKNNSTITAIFALNYGGRDEIIRAIRRLHENFKFQISNFKLSEEIFSSLLDTSGIPDPELIIRTGGEQRLSGFFLWQSEYSELFFPTWYMPEFTPRKLDEAIEEFQNRKRRFGK
ncbi:di-trans,poly-cis-decaprenylcistransferase [Candidatus Gottesmanbacteria bacterium]|nr:di-trans,poly-cis-decaprenylcistransferase [Candidatus Gottesmanbacteria bacterium]